MGQAAYPTPQHEAAAAQIVEFFSQQPGVDSVLLVNSCARGKASPDSCLDIIILVSESFRDAGNGSTVLERGENEGTEALYRAWEEAPSTHTLLASLSEVGRFAEIHFDITDGRVRPAALSRDQAIDGFELSLGNYFAYSVPLWSGTPRFRELQARWLPYYPDALRAERLAHTREFCLHYLDHIEPYVERGLYFQAFDRLYQGFQGFLQGLFIARRSYPIAYNKWIREQVEEILELPELYARLPHILEIPSLESRDVVHRGETLRALVDEYLVE